jgi:hypothetical protein
MGITRITLSFVFASSLAAACAAGGGPEKTGSGGTSGSGSGGSSGTNGANCTASVVCTSTLTYQKCSSATDECYYELSTGSQLPCTVSNPCDVDGGGSGGTAGTGAAGSGGASGTTGTGGSAGTGGTAGTGSGGTAGTGSSCSGIADAGTCETCCETADMEGATTFFNAWGTCLCTSPGACKTQCASTLCMNMPVPSGSPCDTCLQGSLSMGGACVSPVTTACMADPNCVAFNNCANGCP